MSKLSITGQIKVSTLREGFLKEFGLTLRIYDGRSFADPTATLAQVRKKKGSGKALAVAKNMKVGNLEDKFEEEFGLKVQVAGSDDSYLCDNNLTLNGARQEDAKKIGRKERKAARQDDTDVHEGAGFDPQDMTDYKIEIADEFEKESTMNTTKRRFRIECGRLGGEVTIGEVRKEFVDYFIDRDESELIEYVTSFAWEEDIDASIPEPYENFESWTETDEIVHSNGAYVDNPFTYEEVPADGSDDYLDENETTFEGHLLYGREAYQDDEGAPEDMTGYKPVMWFHSSEMGRFGAWFIETIGEDFNPKKIAYNVVETEAGQIIEDLWYDKELIDQDWDNTDTTGMSHYAGVGYMNMKHLETKDKYTPVHLEENYWEDYDDALADAE